MSTAISHGSTTAVVERPHYRASSSGCRDCRHRVSQPRGVGGVDDRRV